MADKWIKLLNGKKIAAQLTKSQIIDFVEGDYVHLTGDETIGGNKTFSDNVTVDGNLTVNGTLTTINSSETNIEDNVINLNVNETGAGVTLGTAGIEIERGTLTNAQIVFDESTDSFKVGIVGNLNEILTNNMLIDTQTIDITYSNQTISADLVYQSTNSITLSEDVSGLKADLRIADTDAIDLSIDGDGLKATLDEVVYNTQIVITTEALTAGDFVNIYDDGNGLKVQKADAATAKPAMGFVVTDVTNGGNAKVYLSGNNISLSTLTVGARYYLGNSGAITVNPTDTTGAIHQLIGYALSPTKINFTMQDYIEIG